MHGLRPAWLTLLALGAVTAACAHPAAQTPAAQTPGAQTTAARHVATQSPAAQHLATPSSPGAAAYSPPGPTPQTGTQPAPSTFVALASGVTSAQLGASWHDGCPVGPAQLSQVHLSYWGLDGKPHLGLLVVNTAAVPDMETVFRTLFEERFPIRQMQPVSVFGGSDPASTAADNTSAFNCRSAVASGPAHWSEHAYGLAVDVNTVENPYLEGGVVQPPNGAPYVVRSPYRPGMAVPGGELVAAFASVGWGWGGRWGATPDYQHFSRNGD